MRLNVPGRVSIIISVLNGEEYIADALDSLINQTLDNLEIVIVDGNSTDHTLEVVNDKLSNSGRIYNIYNVNGPERYTPMGLMWGYQVGAGNSTGEFISFMGDDDLCHSNRFKLMVNALNDNPNAPLSHSSIEYINRYGRVTGRTGGDHNDALYNAVVNNTDDGTCIHVTGFSCLFRKWAYFSQKCYAIGSYFWECGTTLRMFALGNFIYVPESILYLRNWDRQNTADTYRGAINAGYDPNELMFGKYNYAIDAGIRREVDELGLTTAYLDNGTPVNDDWSALIAIFVKRFKKDALRRFQ